MGKQTIRPNLAVVLLTALVVSLAAFLVRCRIDACRRWELFTFKPGLGRRRAADHTRSEPRQRVGART